MNKLLILLSFGLWLGTAVLAQDTLNFYYDEKWNEINDASSADFYRKAYRDSAKLWIVNDYFKSGQLQMTGTYKSKSFKEKEGYFTYYFENGQVLSQGLFGKNMRQGKWTFWYENGNKMREGLVQNDLAVGKWEYWYDNGKMKSTGKFIANKKDSTWVYFHENGAKSAEGKYVDDWSQGTWKYWFDTGELKAEGGYVNNNKHEVWHYYYKNGELSAVDIYYQGMLVLGCGYYENGIKSFEGEYKNGQPDGTWTYWDADGRVTLKGNCMNGYREGKWTRYFASGSMVVNYKAGNIVGKDYGMIYTKE